MNVIRATISDISNILKIFEEAKAYIKSQGFDQWQNEDYPNEEIIQDDISNEASFILCDDDKLLGYMALLFDKEQSYSTISNGKWISDFDYATIHRLAISNDGRGQNLSKLFFEFAEKNCIEKNISSLRIDTHEKNISMKTILKNRKYKYCGIITLENGEKRMAYEKLVIPFLVGDKIQMRKKHPCGSDIFEIKRIGMDFRLECSGCSSQIWLSRNDVEKRLKKRL